MLAFVRCIAGAQGFDDPVSKKVVDLGASPFYRPQQNRRVELRCYFYSRFFVKELDSGAKGADYLAIVPSQGGMEECKVPRSPGEIRVDDWGYYGDAKGNFVFFVAADGTNGGLPFGVYEARRGKKLFEDSDALSYWITGRHERGALKVIHSTSDGITIRYLRVVESECDLHLDADRCWKEVRAKYGIVATGPPRCSGYDEVHTSLVSSVAYPVEVTLPAPAKVNPVEGQVYCWPVD